MFFTVRCWWSIKERDQGYPHAIWSIPLGSWSQTQWGKEVWWSRTACSLPKVIPLTLSYVLQCCSNKWYYLILSCCVIYYFMFLSFCMRQDIFSISAPLLPYLVQANTVRICMLHILYVPGFPQIMCIWLSWWGREFDKRRDNNFWKDSIIYTINTYPSP